MNQTEGLSGPQNLFEMALMPSRDNARMQVLCIDFWPWAVIACCNPLARATGLAR